MGRKDDDELRIRSSATCASCLDQKEAVGGIKPSHRGVGAHKCQSATATLKCHSASAAFGMTEALNDWLNALEHQSVGRLY